MSDGMWQIAGRFLSKLARRIGVDEGMGYAAQIAFYFLFAFFPFLLFLVTLVAYLPLEGIMEAILDWLQHFLPEKAYRLTASTVEDVFTRKHTGLLSVGVAVALYSSTQAMVAMMTGLNRTRGIRDSRQWWKTGLIALGGVFLFTGLTIASALILVFGPKIGAFIAGWFGSESTFVTLWKWIRWLVFPLLLAIMLSVIYWLLPADDRKWKLLTPGSVIAVIFWCLGSLAFSAYVNHFGTYNKTYGSIGAVIILMTWMYLNAFIILAGAEIDSIVYRYREDDQTNDDQ